MAEYDRPDGWRFGPFGGVNVRNAPDAIGAAKYASAKNVRGTSSMALQTRPGYTLLFQTGGLPVTDLGAYAAIGTDDTLRLLARDSSNQIWLDAGTLAATLAGATGYGVSMIPVRPPESSQTWMYIAGLGDYQKLSAPPVTAFKVGIAEPPVPLFSGASTASGVDAVAQAFSFTDFTASPGSWTAGGTAGAPSSSTRVADTAATVISMFNTQIAVQVSGIVQYQIGEELAFGGGGINAITLDVLPAVGSGTIQAIRYDVGTNGTCTMVLSQLPGGSSVPGLGALRRGTLLKMLPSEIILVLGTAIGPSGVVAIFTSTVGSYAPGQAFVGVYGIVVDGSVGITAGMSISGTGISSSVTTGIGTLTQTIATSPFSVEMVAGILPREDDYVHFSLRVSDPTKINEVRLQFNVDPIDNTFTQNIYTYAVQPSLLAPVLANTQTVLQAELGALVQSTVPPGTNLPDETAASQSQWVEIRVPISDLIKLGDDQSATLVNTRAVQILVNCSGTVTVTYGSLWVGGGYAPDVGDDGADYLYRARPRSSVTGAKGNATPPMRYGVRPRRQQVKVTVPESGLSMLHDPQIDTWDFYRIGGTITSYRYIGSSRATVGGQAFFIDNYFDDAAAAGDALEIDNLEPWPSIDVPFRVDTTQATILTFGTWITVSGFSAWPATINRWLPGTLVQLGSQSAYTLRARPHQLTSASYLFQIEECIDAAISPAFFAVLEPQVGNQILPYLFGPDVEGTVFGVGDPLRPGVLSYSKPSTADSAPSQNTIELCPPSEPLLGGIIKGGVAVVASTKRWWALYPKAGGGYNPIEQSVGRGIVSPSLATDGERIYFWARDGICATDGGPYKDLTLEDFYNLFPHEGVVGSDVTRLGVTYHAPDYSAPAAFRLSKVNSYLRADYPGTGGTYHNLILDLGTGGWCADEYAHQITVGLLPQQQSGALTATPTLYPLGLLADTAGHVWQQKDCAGDSGNQIPCLVGTFEWDGGDPRALEQWGDGYLDCVPLSKVTVTPVSFGQSVNPPTIINPSTTRQLAVIDVGGAQLQKFMGLKIEWTE